MTSEEDRAKRALIKKLHDMVDELANMPDWVWKEGSVFPTLRVTLERADRMGDDAVTLVVGIEDADDKEAS